MTTSDLVKLYAKIAGVVLVFLLAIAGLFSIGRCSRNQVPDPKIIVQVDTLYLHDTIRNGQC